MAQPFHWNEFYSLSNCLSCSNKATFKLEYKIDNFHCVEWSIDILNAILTLIFIKTLKENSHNKL